jgi:hypothetical protein
MRRVVRAQDRRTWVLRSKISWTGSAGEDFEHDMADRYVHGIAMVGVIVALTLFVVFWTPPDVVIPAWFVLLILLLVLLVPVGWALQRPWVITADTDEPVGSGGEHWMGEVRGAFTARDQIERIAESLRTRGTPDDGVGPLTLVTPSREEG